MGKGTKRTIDQGIRPHLQEETRTRRAELKKTTTTGPLTYPLGNCELDFPWLSEEELTENVLKLEIKEYVLPELIYKRRLYVHNVQNTIGSLCVSLRPLLFP